MASLSLCVAFSCLVSVVSAIPAPYSDEVVCPHPPPPGSHASLTSSSGTGSEQWANYQCDPQFVRASGQSSLECSNGIWFGDALGCQSLHGSMEESPVYNCPAPPPAGNSASVTTTGEGTSQWALYTCNPGFIWASGQASIDCEDGEWATENTLSCMALDTEPVHQTGGKVYVDVHCPSAPAPGANAFLSSVSGTGGNQWASYLCFPGHVWASGQSSIDCLDGVYSSENTLACTALPVEPVSHKTYSVDLPCPPAPTPGAHAFVSGVSGEGANQWANYQCSPGFTWLSGQSSIECIAGEYTTEDTLACQALHTEPSYYSADGPCPHAPAPGDNAELLSVTGEGSNQWALYGCPTGFIWASGQSSLDCANGVWANGEPLSCRPLHDPHPSVVHPPSYQ